MTRIDMLIDMQNDMQIITHDGWNFHFLQIMLLFTFYALHVTFGNSHSAFWVLHLTFNHSNPAFNIVHSWWAGTALNLRIFHQSDRRLWRRLPGPRRGSPRAVWVSKSHSKITFWKQNSKKIQRRHCAFVFRI